MSGAAGTRAAQRGGSGQVVVGGGRRCRGSETPSPRAWLAGVPPPGPSSRHGAPCPQEERRVVFIGKIPSRMTRSELRHRFSVFGDIEECTLHFRSEG